MEWRSTQVWHIAGSFGDLLRKTHARYGERIVVLVDEYDKPILDNLGAPDTARELRDGLRNLYSVIKGADAHPRFAFLTGVSKFSKMSLFSGLNNLINITVDPTYSAVCGYTEADLDAVFAPELNGLDRELWPSRLYELRLANDFDGLRELFSALFAGIPSDWYRNNLIARYEGYYASVFYAYFASLGLDLTPEDSSNAGRLDMALRFNGQLYLFEFKVVELAPEGRALQQIRDRGFADKYRAEGLPSNHPPAKPGPLNS